MLSDADLSYYERTGMYPVGFSAYEFRVAIATQAREANALLEDAERYRFFRDALVNSDEEEPAFWIQDFIGTSLDEGEVDAAIDAARRGT